MTKILKEKRKSTRTSKNKTTQTKVHLIYPLFINYLMSFNRKFVAALKFIFIPLLQLVQEFL